LVAYAALDSGALGTFTGISALDEQRLEDWRSLSAMSITITQTSPANPINKPMMTSVMSAYSSLMRAYYIECGVKVVSKWQGGSSRSRKRQLPQGTTSVDATSPVFC
jgi:hypothetical protein